MQQGDTENEVYGKGIRKIGYAVNGYGKEVLRQGDTRKRVCGKGIWKSGM